MVKLLLQILRSVLAAICMGVLWLIAISAIFGPVHISNAYLAVAIIYLIPLMAGVGLAIATIILIIEALLKRNVGILIRAFTGFAVSFGLVLLYELYKEHELYGRFVLPQGPWSNLIIFALVVGALTGIAVGGQKRKID